MRFICIHLSLMDQGSRYYLNYHSDSFDKGLLSQSSRTFYSLPIVIWTPGGWIDVHIAQCKGQCLTLHSIAHGSVQHSYSWHQKLKCRQSNVKRFTLKSVSKVTSNPSIIRNAHPTNRVIGFHCYLAGTTSAMGIGRSGVISGHGIIVFIVQVSTHFPILYYVPLMFSEIGWKYMSKLVSKCNTWKTLGKIWFQERYYTVRT